MLRIDPENMRILDAAALNHYGLTSVDPIAKEMYEMSNAQRLGIARTEYMRRKQLALRICANSATVCYQRILETGMKDPRVSPDQIDFSQFGRPARPEQ
jgi:hypothetical protein